MPYRECDFCGARYYKRPSVLKEGMGKYCSKSCSNRAANPAQARRIAPDIEAAIIDAYEHGASTSQAGAAFGIGRGGVQIVLKRNGVRARTYSEAGQGRVFTDEWRAKISANHADVSGGKNPMFGKPPGHGTRIFVPHLDKWVRSTWEATVAGILLQLGIEHEYESHRITLDAHTTYLPDFYLPTYDLHIEVKGWYNERAKRILPRITDEHPELRLLIIGQDLYSILTRDPSALLAHLPPAI